ncbi:MAG TPA: threonine/serine dehydratase [Nocardioidaceae bacterium]|nr:threonine/serine dehydratase [Nocardioidaceae bacterium]
MVAMTDLVTIADIDAAATRIEGRIRRTPLLASELATGAEPLFVKAESLQLGGSFKIRGALNAVSQLSREERSRGIVTHSSGNHAQAVARAARSFGLACTVVMPRTAPDVKRAATGAQGATVLLVEPQDRETTAARISAETGAVLVPPYDDPAVIAGQGTVGAEIASDLAAMDVDSVDTVYVPVSGGGLISGIAVAVKARLAGARVVAVEPTLAADLAEGWARGERVVWDPAVTARTIADGLQVPGVGELNWQHIRALVDDVITVSEEEIVAALRRLVLEAKLVCEPSGATAMAGYLADVQGRSRSAASVVVVSGGNIEPAMLSRLIA